MARIAVVDDDEDILHSMQDMLRERGWDTNVPIHEETPFADLQGQHPDLIVLDLWLGVSDAQLKLLHHLKRKGSTRDVPIIVCTGVPDQLTDHDEWLRRNGVRIVPVPCDVSDLDKAIAEGLAHAPVRA